MNNTSTPIREYLSELGLSSDEIKVYLLLTNEGALTAKEISERLGIIVNSIYRATNFLLDKELIKELDITPKHFQAITPSVAIEQLAAKRILKIKNSSQSAVRKLDIKKNPNRLNMELLTGRVELFDRFVDLAKEAEQEILVISIGEPVPESIWSVTENAIARDVSPKYIFHKNDKGNVMLIKRWRAMGVPVRHLPGEGYHLNIFDHSSAILSASNPKQSKERSGVVIYNEAIIEALRTYFFQQWALAEPV